MSDSTDIPDAAYVPALVYYAERDEFEFVTRDTATVYRDLLPSDGVAIIFDMTSRDPIGFRVAGSMVRAANPPAAGGVSEARVDNARLDVFLSLVAAVEAERRRVFCSGPDCDDYDHGRDEGLDLAVRALRGAFSISASDALAPAAGQPVATLMIGQQSLVHIAELAAKLRSMQIGSSVPVTSEFHEIAMVLSAVAPIPEHVNAVDLREAAHRAHTAGMTAPTVKGAR